MPFLTRPHFEDRQIVQYSDEVIHLSGTSYIAATVLDFTGTTSAETSVTINTLTGYLNGQRLSGLVVEPARLKLSGSTGTTTQNVTGFVLQSIDPYGSVEWAPLSGVSWSVSACTSPLYVSTLEACPNPTDPMYITAGNVQFGATPSLIADITNTRLGIGTGSPSESLHVNGGDMLIETSNGKFYTDLDSATGPRVILSGSPTDLISIAASEIGVPAGVSIGARGFSEALLTGYGKQGDGFVYSSAEQNGLNIISQQGTSKDDYIRFYAGQDASAASPDLYIQGSGTTRGNVGINTDEPEEKLHIVDGNLLIEHDQNSVTSGVIRNLVGGNLGRAAFSLQVSGLTQLVSGTIIGFGINATPTGTFLGSYLPNSLNITTAGGTLTDRQHINIGSRRGTDAQTRFFGGSDDFNNSSLLGIFYTSGLTITDMVNTDTLRVRDGATSGYVLTSDAQGNATWQYNSTGFSGNTSGTCITDLHITNLYGCSPITVHDNIQSVTSSATGATSLAFGFQTKAHGDYSHAEGFGTTASGSNSHAQNRAFIASGTDSHAEGFETVSSGNQSHAEGSGTVASGNQSHAQGLSTQATGTTAHAEGQGSKAFGDYSHAGGWNSRAFGDVSYSQGLQAYAYGDGSNAQGGNVIAHSLFSFVGGQSSTSSGDTSFVYSKGSTLSADNSAILGGLNIDGTTSETVYVPNLTVRNDFILHSDDILEVSDLPSNYEDIIKGSYTSFDWSGITANAISNNDPHGYTTFVLGNLNNYPTNNTYGFISYFNSGHTRASFSGPVGDDFYRDKIVIKGGNESEGMVINPHGDTASASLWFEMSGRSVMKLKGDGSTKARLGIAMSEDGTEDATANLQIGGTGTTGTFRYIDGNQQSGYVLTSDSNGLASWAPPSFTGNTSATCISDLYVTNVYGCSPITFHDNIQSSNSSATGTTSFAFGENSKSNATSAFSFGTNLTVNGERSFAGGGLDNTLGSGTDNAILGGSQCVINSGAIGSAIIGGSGNIINPGVNRSVIIGGSGRVAVKSDTIYMPALVSGSIACETGGFNNQGSTTLQGKVSLTGFFTTTGTDSPASSAVTTSSIWKIRLTGANTSTLPNGDSGQRLIIYVTDDGGGGNSMTITPTTFNGFTAIQLNNLGESIELIWDDAAGWTVLGGHGYALV